MGFIRLLLAFNVLKLHVTADGSDFGLFTAVPSFFIISGFFMSFIYIEKYSRKHNSYLIFLTNRILRIYPLYWLILVTTIVYNYFLFYFRHSGLFATPQNLGQTGFFLYTPLVNIISDFTLLIKTDYLNINLFYQQPLLLAVEWTLVVEMVFYVLVPLLTTRPFRTLLWLLMGSLGVRYAIIRYCIAHHHAIAQVFFPASLIYFILGICSYRLYIYLKKRPLPKKYGYLFFSLMILMTLIWNQLNIRIEVKEWIYLILLVLLMPSIFLLFAKSKTDRFFGELSYPFFLSHVLVGQIYTNIFGEKTDQFLKLILVTLITISISWLLVFLVNKPIDRYRQKRLLN